MPGLSPSFLLLLLLLLLLPGSSRAPPAPPSPAPCGLRSVSVGVGALGLGYPSPESVVFRYCWGGCPAPPTLHGLALGAVLGAGGGSASGGGGPCCRPTRYEDVAFLDSELRWQRLPRLSAGACACLG
ncbi:LOW QUALITY PROTEIN: persephin [Hirundo rustica]|uniref:LOW QUALITY PROTEIN: persephin n=1 Tax=Hirundo rustica TaxID=43150 RepID=UPI001A94E69F|nr:LOW QUALITY PROTEIN: persephin [Hirundo rustica]